MSIAMVRSWISTGRWSVPLRDDDRHLDNQMQAPVARGLRLFDVVRLADDVVRLRPGQQAAQIVDIVQIVADDADSGHILNVRVDIVDGQLIAAALELFSMLSSDLIRYSMWWMGSGR